MSSTLTAITEPIGEPPNPVRGLVAATVGVGVGAVDACTTAFGLGLLHPPIVVAANTHCQNCGQSNGMRDPPSRSIRAHVTPLFKGLFKGHRSRPPVHDS